jgi:Domain of unknown function (DUF4386)
VETNGGEARSSSDVVRDDRWAFRVGGGSAMLGAILGLVGNLIHPGTSGPAHPAETARVVAHSSIWIPLHVALLVSFIFMLGGLVAIHDSITRGRAAVVARFGLIAAIVGTAGGVVLLSLDGFAAKHLADSWLAAPSTLRASALASFRAEDSINFALLSPLNLVFAGFTFVLFGVAAAQSGVYPRWLGLVAVVGGVGGAVSGVIQAYPWRTVRNHHSPRNLCALHHHRLAVRHGDPARAQGTAGMTAKPARIEGTYNGRASARRAIR